MIIIINQLHCMHLHYTLHTIVDSHCTEYNVYCTVVLYTMRPVSVQCTLTGRRINYNTHALCD